MKKILLTINNNSLAGIERFVLLVCENIDKSRFDITVALPCNGEITEIFEIMHQKYFVFNRANTIKLTLSGVLSLFRLIKKEKFDVIHAQAGILPCILGKICGVKKIIEHKHGLDYTYEEIIKMGVFKKFYEKIKKYFVDKTITVCKYDKDILVKYFGYKSNQITVLYNCVGIKNINPSSCDRINVIANIGRLTRQKAQEVFISMVSIVSPRFPHIKFKIYGKGELYEYYKGLIDKNNLGDVLEISGFEKDIDRLFNSIDLLVLSSRYEGIPFVLLEAMSYRIPVVSTDVGGIPEVVQHGYNGLLGKSESPESLAECVISLIENKYSASEIAEHGYRTIFEKFSVQRMITELNEIYEA